MKTYRRDIIVTLCVKLCLLTLLWWCCVKDHKPVLLSGPAWFLEQNHVSTNPLEATK